MFIISRNVLIILFCSLFIACGGVPLKSIPKLFSVPEQLLNSDPAEFALAIGVDENIQIDSNAVPYLDVGIKPAEEGTFEPINLSLTMKLSELSSEQLSFNADKNYRWLLYQLTDDSAEQLREIQNFFKERKKREEGGELSIGIKQHNIAVDDPNLEKYSWVSWVRFSHQQSFFKLWEGTLGELKAVAE